MGLGNQIRFNPPFWLVLFFLLTAGFSIKAQSQIAFDNEVFRAGLGTSVSATEVMETSSTVTVGQERVWKMSGPFGGDVAAMAIDPRNSHRLFVGTNDGQLFRSVDDGITWQRVKPGVKTPGYSLGIIHFDREHPNVIYIGATQIKDAVSDATGGAMFVSEDGGEVWREIEVMRGRSIRGLVQSAKDTNMLLVAARDGIYRSKDRGTTWERITPDNDPELRNFHSVATDPRDANVIFVGTTHLPWKTADGGLTWTRAGTKETGMIDDSDIFCISIDGTNPDTMFMSACSGIYKSTNASEKWTKIQGIPFTSRRTHVIFQHPSRPEVVFAGTTEGLWYTKDGGQTWSMGGMSPRRQVINAVAIHPEQPDRVYIGTEDNGILISTDGGETFEPSNLGFINRQIRVVAHDRTERGRVYAGISFDGANGGLYVSEDSGLTWQQSGRGMGISDVYAIHQSLERPETIYAGTNHGLYRSEDRGLSWAKVVKEKEAPVEPPKDQPKVKNVVQTRPQKATAKGKATPQSKTINKPRNPVIKKPVPAEPAPEAVPVDDSFDLQKQIFSIAPIYPRSSSDSGGLIAATWDGLFITRDEKKGWKQIKFDNPMHPYFNVVTTNPMVPGVVLVGADDKLFVSYDNGETFSPMTIAPKTLRILNVLFDPREPATIYVGTNDGFFLTYDGGKTWEQRGNGMRTSIATSAIVINPNNPDELYVGDQRQGGLYHSTDKGRSWEPIETLRLPSQRLYTMSADPFDPTGVCIGSFSGGVYLMNKQVAGRKRQIGQ
ncbi:MAG: hypothetical protein JST84_06620 [Acidobacteria bacterium]|nr:hypothetical protein [Acidobacteriota bacterium]